ncbi:Dabb family protein [Flavonifractor sp. An100]|uniref:Dabb family protein n=1 Tax=Flavonifractor sp. An100 TaxID=1965538 RepID=UPI000B38C33E|nr:Dabb family protein [Flavonifractor sp. An100]OUQ75688.1 hypothetical protein B5E43_13300 [Flavonifractor sp. An100]
MVCHLVSWNFKPELTQAQREEAGKDIVARLEALKDKIPCLVDIRAYCPPLDSSNCDLVLYSLVEKEEDLPAYQNHPDHLAAAGVLKASFGDRRCCDFSL